MTLQEKFDKLDSYITKSDIAYRFEVDYFGFFLEIRQLDMEVNIWVTVEVFSDTNIDGVLSQAIAFLDDSQDNVVHLDQFR